MSRIGKLPISLPKDVDCTLAEGKVTIKGPKGQLEQYVEPTFKITLTENQMTISCPSKEKQDKAKHGLYRSLLANMVTGVVEGYKKEIEIVGVGYKVTVQNNVLDLSLGYSHNIVLSIPVEIQVQAIQERGKNPIIILESIDKQLVGQMAAKIKSLRPVEPYKGKGIRLVGEYVRRKAGKASSSK